MVTDSCGGQTRGQVTGRRSHSRGRDTGIGQDGREPRRVTRRPSGEGRTHRARPPDRRERLRERLGEGHGAWIAHHDKENDPVVASPFDFAAVTVIPDADTP